MAQITVNSDIVIPNGPKLGFRRALTVEAFDKIDVTVPSNTEDREVQLQPGDAEKVKFVLIVADWYGDELSYTVNTAGATKRTLDEPHLFTGAGAVSMLDSVPPASLFFSNATSEANANAKDAVVQILIGRDATP